MKKVLRLSLVGVVLAVLIASSGATAAPTDGQVVPGQYIVLVSEGVDPAAVASDHGVAARHVYRAALKGFAAALPANKVADLDADPRVLVIEPDRIYRVVEIEQVLPTGIDRIEADLNPYANGVTVKLDVAIIDTGINKHEDLNLAGGKNFTGGSTTNYNDGYNHGTHVAGTVGAIDNDIGVVGVAPGVSLWAVKVCNNGGICFTSNMIAGIDWVAARKADYKASESGGINFAVANMSLGTSDDAEPCTQETEFTDALHWAVCGLVESGVPLALAAGNDSGVKNAYPEVLAVSAIADFDGKAGGAAAATCRSDKDDTLADFSDYGPSIDIAAPGVCILSTSSTGDYFLGSGTSMAAPHVAGAVALYLHANPDVGPAINGAEVDEIEAAIIGAALLQGDVCGYTNEHASQGSDEPLLFVNNPTFGGDEAQTCEVAGAVATGSIAGTVTNASDGTATIGGATVSVDTGQSATTAADGTYTITDVPTGDRSVTASADGFESQSKTAAVTENETTTVDFALNPIPVGSIAGKVTESDVVTAISGASVVVEGTSLSATTDADGDYSIGNVPEGTYDVTASADGFVSETKTGLTVTADTTTEVNFALNPVTTATTVSVDSITYATQGGRNNGKHLNIAVALVDDLGNPVVGASVSIRLDNTDTGQSWTGTGTTGTDGTVTFRFNNAPSGCYTTTVTNVTAEGLTWHGETPANESCK